MFSSQVPQHLSTLLVIIIILSLYIFHPLSAIMAIVNMRSRNKRTKLTSLGPTNFSAVFLENSENLGNEAIQISTDASESYVPSYESLQPQTFLMLSGKGQEQCVSPRIALGAKVLNAFPDRATCQFLMDRYITKGYHGIYPKESVVATASSMWCTFPSAMKFPRRAADLEAASTLLCANAERGLEEREEYGEWLKSCTGTNLRWEVVGQVYGAFAGSILSLGEKDPFFGTQEGERRSRRLFAVEMKECVQACVTLSNFVDLINMPMVALLIKNLVLQTVISGDACEYISSLKFPIPPPLFSF
jgi:hypothetical protein